MSRVVDDIERAHRDAGISMRVEEAPMSETVKRYWALPMLFHPYGEGGEVQVVLASDHERAMAEKEVKLQRARDALSRMNEAFSICDKAKEKAEAALASLKARCEGMRGALVEAHTAVSQARHYVSHREYPRALEILDASEATIIASLPVEGIVERVKAAIMPLIVDYGADMGEQTNEEMADEYTAKIIAVIGGTR